MRGSKAQIRVFEENRVTRRLLLRSMVLYNVCTLVVYFINKERSMLVYLARSVPEALAVYYLYRISTPVIALNGGTKTLVSPGAALNGKGHVSVAFDFLFISMLVKLMLLYSGKSWLLYLFFVISCCYEFLYKPLTALKKSTK
ncbi:srp-independent targeting protein [Encephalitozoon hellem]|nr:srp-independent targeting protein [Encephalitozoon hellem]